MDLLAARSDGLEERLRLVGEQHERDTPRRFLERLEQGLLRGFQQRLRIVDDQDTAVAFQWK